MSSSPRTPHTAASASSAGALSSEDEELPVVHTYSAYGAGRGPLLDLEVLGKDGHSVIDAALIDTGASGSAFPLHWRKKLGIRYDECRRRRVATANGMAKRLVYLDGVEALILGRRLTLQASFVDTSIALLGRDDFLHVFRVEFEQPYERFVISPWPGPSTAA